jgi:hypothetical protein
MGWLGWRTLSLESSLRGGNSVSCSFFMKIFCFSIISRRLLRLDKKANAEFSGATRIVPGLGQVMIRLEELPNRVL